MCGCAEALVRAVVAFFDTVLVDYFLSWFRHRPGPDSLASAHWDPLVPKDRGGEALPASDEEKGFAESIGSNEQLADGDDTDEELRREVCASDGVSANAHDVCEWFIDGEIKFTQYLVIAR